MPSLSSRTAFATLVAVALAGALTASPAAASSWSADGTSVQVAMPAADFDLLGTIRRLLGIARPPAGAGRLHPNVGCVGDPDGGSQCANSALPPVALRLKPSVGCGGDPNGGSQCTSSSRPQARLRLKPSVGCGGDPDGGSQCANSAPRRRG